MEYATLNGGKRIRPILAYGAALAVGGNLSRADHAACAIELIHCYSLIHDDLPAMDDDDLRRGAPTVHKAFSEATAILAGDALQSLAFQVIASSTSVEPSTQLKMIDVLARASGLEGMAAGQSLDFEAVGELLDLEQLQTMHSLKTGALITASVELGALSSPMLKDEQLVSLGNYAAHIGLAFQIQDDILDVTADTTTLGKPQGADRLLNKPTYTSLLGLDGARGKASNLADLAISELDEFSSQADVLRQLALYIVQRTH
ncbi:MAG: polyprenyl synthetase family protein [Gammaproteobacteria bacterium]|nr:polyprenyl synthetase family protein [Gammaproteobacteria bacterium]